MDFLSTRILGHSAQDWLIAVGAGMCLLIVVRSLLPFLAKRFRTLDGHRDDNVYGLIASLLQRTSFTAIAVLSIYVGSRFLHLAPNTETWLSALAVIAAILQTARWGNALIDFWLKRYQIKNLGRESERLTTLRAIGFICRVGIVAIAVLLALDNIPGVEITALVASLGIGGIAVAMAVQNVLSDLFASLSIVLDKPFVYGDFIIVDNHLGSVENIGLKTTRLRSLSGEQLIFSNSDLLRSRIRNYKRMAERRVVFSIGVVYQTPHDKLKNIPDMIRRIVKSQNSVRFDRAHFQGFGESALTFEVVYYVLSPDYNIYMDIQQAINLGIVQCFEREEISFAFPTQTVHVQTVDGRSAMASFTGPHHQARFLEIERSGPVNRLGTTDAAPMSR
jgi:small-conductance mechanosensitive channel